jgi:hypothetical protein
LIHAGRYKEALDVVKEYNPFPASVGRVCNHPCEEKCNRGKLDTPVSICALKRFVADWVYEHPDESKKEEVDDEISEIKPTEIDKKLRGINERIEKHDMALEKTDLSSNRYTVTATEHCHAPVLLAGKGVCTIRRRYI